MAFDAAHQSGIFFDNGDVRNGHIWYFGAGNIFPHGVRLNTSSFAGDSHIFIEDVTGQVGIGDDTPNAIFDVEGADDGCNFGSRSGSQWGYVNTQRPTGSSNLVIQRWRDGTFSQMTVNNDADAYQLTVLGSGLASGGMWDNSDAKLKENVRALEAGTLVKLMRLSPKTYTWKKDAQYDFLNLKDRQQIGFLAQELEAEFPEVVQTTTQTDADGEVAVDHELKSVNYSALVPVLTKAIQEQQEMIEALQARIELLEKK